jgi:hypothetical protein
MQAHIASRTKCTSVKLGCNGRLDTPPASTRGHFSQRALAGALICRPKRSPSEGSFSGSGEQGNIISLSSSSSSPSLPLETLTRKGFDPTPPPHVFVAAWAWYGHRFLRNPTPPLPHLNLAVAGHERSSSTG